MAKWYGKVGYMQTVNTRPGIWEPQTTEYPYSGDILSNVSKWTSSDKVNDNLDVANRISIVGDPFAYQNFSAIKYVEFMGALWEVKSVEVAFPRLILTIGGVYNGQQT